MLQRKGLAIFAVCAAMAWANPLRASDENASATPTDDQAVFADDQTTTRAPLMELLHDAGIGDTLEKWGINISGFVEGSYNYNFEKPLQNPGGAPLPHLSVGRVFDQKYDALLLNQAELMIARNINADPNKWDFGFAMEWIYGHDADYIHANGLNFYGPGAGTHPDLQFDLTQAYVTMNAPLGNGLLVEAGKFVTPVGYEYINPTQNPLYSHSYLFGFAIPFTQTGVMATYAFTPQWSVMGGFSRGWDQSLKDTNGDNMDYMAQVAYNSADKKLNGALSTIIGPEQPKNDSNWRYLIDGVAKYNWSDQITLGLNGDFAYERHAALAPGDVGKDAVWFGVAGYASYKFDDRFTLNSRLEYFNDHDAARGLGSEFYEATLGLAVTPFPDNQWLKGLMVRPEVRYDYSVDGGVFVGTERNWQITVGGDAIYAF